MIVVAGGIKGGSGKTTVATNLAVIRAAQGPDVPLVDADDQETATDFTALRNERLAGGAGYTGIKLGGPAVRTETIRLAQKYADIVIDTGGRDTTSQRAALAVADVLLVPFVPRSFDVWTLERVSHLVAEMRTANPALLAFTFINRADPRGQDNDDAAAQGLAVTELKPQDAKATEEILTLISYVFAVNPTANRVAGGG